MMLMSYVVCAARGLFGSSAMASAPWSSAGAVHRPAVGFRTAHVFICHQLGEAFGGRLGVPACPEAFTQRVSMQGVRF
jgi:hypothetical protein